jgi:hypothetical protein
VQSNPVENLTQINETGPSRGQFVENSTRSVAMPLENIFVLGIVAAGMLAFSVVAGWLTWESGKQRDIERHQAAAE